MNCHRTSVQVDKVQRRVDEDIDLGVSLPKRIQPRYKPRGRERRLNGHDEPLTSIQRAHPLDRGRDMPESLRELVAAGYALGS